MKKKRFKDFRDGLINPVPNNRYADEYYIDKREKEKEKLFNRKWTLYDDGHKQESASSKLSDLIIERYGYRQTASGNWRERDEPDEDEQYRQNDEIKKFLQKKKAFAARNRLRTSGKVPVRARTGEKIFESIKNKRPVCTYDKNDEGSIAKCLFAIGQNAYDFEDFIYMLGQLVDAIEH